MGEWVWIQTNTRKNESTRGKVQVSYTEGQKKVEKMKALEKKFKWLTLKDKKKVLGKCSGEETYEASGFELWIKCYRCIRGDRNSPCRNKQCVCFWARLT